MRKHTCTETSCTTQTAPNRSRRAARPQLRGRTSPPKHRTRTRLLPPAAHTWRPRRPPARPQPPPPRPAAAPNQRPPPPPPWERVQLPLPQRPGAAPGPCLRLAQSARWAGPAAAAACAGAPSSPRPPAAASQYPFSAHFLQDHCRNAVLMCAMNTASVLVERRSDVVRMWSSLSPGAWLPCAYAPLPRAQPLPLSLPPPPSPAQLAVTQF